MTINQRINAIRKEMHNLGLDAYIIPSTDPHQSEYVAKLWESRAWISGFSGSAGTAIITKDHAGLWTDSRYFLQADDELSNSEFELHKIIKQGTPEHETWLSNHLAENTTVGFDRSMFSAGQIEGLHKRMAKKNISINGENDLIEKIWVDRPLLPDATIIDHPISFSGESRVDKLNRLRAKLKEEGVIKYLITTLDDIAWLFNIRGSDVNFNPVIVSYAIITLDNAILFINSEKVPEDLKTAFTKDHIELN